MNRNKAYTFICKKLLNIKTVPAGWKPRKAHDYEWNLVADKGSPRPLGVYVKRFDDQIYYSHKNGYQASLGEFAGRSCRIAPLRNTLREAIKDCFEFMEAHNDKRLLRIRLDEQYFAQNLATSIF